MYTYNKKKTQCHALYISTVALSPRHSQLFNVAEKQCATLKAAWEWPRDEAISTVIRAYLDTI